MIKDYTEAEQNEIKTIAPGIKPQIEKLLRQMAGAGDFRVSVIDACDFAMKCFTWGFAAGGRSKTEVRFGHKAPDEVQKLTKRIKARDARNRELIATLVKIKECSYNRESVVTLIRDTLVKKEDTN